MGGSSQNLSLGEAASCFLVSLLPEQRETSQQVVNSFVRWYGWERTFARLSAPEVANYAEHLSLSDTDYVKKLELIRAFLVYAKKEGWSKINLGTHLKTRKGNPKSRFSDGRCLPKTISLTQQGYTELEAELAALKSKRTQAIEEMRRAAADKDFSENAPLDAAKEHRGQLEGRIKELEAALKSARIIDEKQNTTLKVGIGDSIILRDLASEEELHYIIVDPKEVDPAKGKISNASPLGKAVIGQGEGGVVEVIVPAGSLRYQIQRIER